MPESLNETDPARPNFSDLRKSGSVLVMAVQRVASLPLAYVAAIRFFLFGAAKTWMPGSGPSMTGGLRKDQHQITLILYEVYLCSFPSYLLEAAHDQAQSGN
jgi:hypothetical protein